MHQLSLVSGRDIIPIISFGLLPEHFWLWLSSRRVGEKGDLGLLRQFGGKFIGQAERHTSRLAMVHARRQRLAIAGAASFAQVAMFCEERKIVDPHPPVRFIFMFPYDDATFADDVTMFLLTGDLASMAAGAVLVVDGDTVTGHDICLRRKSCVGCRASSGTALRRTLTCCIAARG